MNLYLFILSWILMECCNVDLWNTEFKAKKWKTQVLTTWLIVEVWPTNLGKSCILSQEAFAKQSGWFISCTLEPPWMACKEIHSIGPFLKPVKPYITQKTRAFQVGYKTGQYQLSDEHSTTILAIPPRKGRLLFPTQNNTLWGGGICLKITIFLYCLTAPKWMIQGSKV